MPIIDADDEKKKSEAESFIRRRVSYFSECRVPFSSGIHLIRTRPDMLAASAMLAQGAGRVSPSSGANPYPHPSRLRLVSPPPQNSSVLAGMCDEL